MADDELIDQLFEIFEDFVIQNRALTAALKDALAHLPEGAQAEIRRSVESTLSDEGLHAMVRSTVAQCRNQPLSLTLQKLRIGAWREKAWI
jgi:hypothetical protein